MCHTILSVLFFDFDFRMMLNGVVYAYKVDTVVSCYSLE